MQTSLFDEAELNDAQVTEINRSENILDEDYLKVIVKAIKRSGRVCLDYETTGLNMKKDWLVGVGLAWKDQEFVGIGKTKEVISSVYIPVGHVTNTRQLPIDIVLSALQEIFDACEVTAFNLNFEMKVSRKYRLRINKYRDVRHDAVQYDENNYKLSLKDIAENILGVKWGTLDEIATKKVKEKNKSGKWVTRKVLDVPATSIPKLGDYCRYDCVYTIQLEDYFADKIFHAKRILEIEKRLIIPVTKIEERGIYVDKQALDRKTEAVKQELERLNEEIYKSAGEVFNINSPPQLAKILFEKLGLPQMYRKINSRNCASLPKG
jgi:DNA polymerase-1